MLVAVVVAAVAGGAAGCGVSLHGQSLPITEPAVTSASATPIPLPTKPPIAVAPTPVPWTAPSTIAYMEPGAVSFPTAADGWVVGDACDAQQDCEVGVARTTDGGASWARVASPGDPDPHSAELNLVAASSEDAWVWGTDSDGDTVFVATHDGGESWQPAEMSGPVVDMAVADGTVWAVIGCAQDVSACVVSVVSAPVSGGAWTGLAPLPDVVQGAPALSSALFDTRLVRSGTSAWLLDFIGGLEPPVAVRTDDGGLSWSSLSLPCIAVGTMILGASSANDLMLVCAADGTSSPAPQDVWTSSDGGAHWLLCSRDNEAGYSPPAANDGGLDNGGDPWGLAVISSSTAWMINDNEYPLVTRNGGVTWTAAPLPPALTTVWQGGGVLDVTFADLMDGWIASELGLWATSDGGAAWEYQPIIGPVPGWSASPGPTG